jgi:NitT/TauT family transport system permease protein
VKYALLISLVLFVLLELSAFVSLGENAVHSFPSPGTIFTNEGAIGVALLYSFVRIWYVYFICVLVSVPLGISIALSNKAYTVAVPVLEIIASIPAPILLPVITGLALHSGEVVAAIIIFLGMIWYILFNVMGGIRSMPTELWELRKELRVSTFSAWRNIYVPAILTSFVTGSITAIGAAWNTLIVAEFFCISQNGSCTNPVTSVGIGIGKIIEIATITSPPDLATLTLAVLSMTVIIVIFNLTVWRRVYHFVTRKYTYNR